MEDEIPKKTILYFFVTKIFQVLVKREMLLNLDPGLRTWWLQCEYEEQIGNAHFSSLLATSSYDFQHSQPPPSSQGP